MAYTRAWNNALPDGTENASTIDDLIKNLKNDISERMNSTLINLWTADPLVVKPAILGNVIDKHLNIGFSDFQCNVGDNLNTNNRIITTSGTWVASVKLPTDVIVKSVSFLFSKSAGSGSAKFTRILYQNPATITDLSAFALGNVLAVQSSGAINETVLEDALYHLTIVCSGGGTFTLYGAQVNYDVPDCRSTL